jgi:hypothetical protein
VTGNADNSRQWRHLRVFSRLSMAMFVLYLPVVALGIFALNAISPGLGEREGFWLFAVWGLIFIVINFYQISFRCPGCGGWFGSSNTWTNPIAGRCLHCGLARYANPSVPK